MLLNLTNQKLTLLQVMAWWRQATSITWPIVVPDLCNHMASMGVSVSALLLNYRPSYSAAIFYRYPFNALVWLFMVDYHFSACCLYQMNQQIYHRVQGWTQLKIHHAIVDIIPRDKLSGNNIALSILLGTIWRITCHMRRIWLQNSIARTTTCPILLQTPSVILVQ